MRNQLHVIATNHGRLEHDRSNSTSMANKSRNRHQYGELNEVSRTSFT